MNLLRIAARVAAEPVAAAALEQMELNGPFKKSEPQGVATVDIPFGIGGAILPVLFKDLGFEGPEFEEERHDIEYGPAGEMEVGYEVTYANHIPEERESRSSPGSPAEFELNLKITHINGIELSGEDSKLADSWLEDMVKDQVHDHESEKAMGEPDFDEGDYGDY
jgi:hypothetical protein